VLYIYCIAGKKLLTGFKDWILILALSKSTERVYIPDIGLVAKDEIASSLRFSQ